MDIISISKNRNTTKQYDSGKKISADDLQKICTLLQYSPSSVNSQPWHFIIVGSEEGKNKIMPAISEFNHPRVEDSSHLVIFCAKIPLDDAYLDEVLAQEEKDGRFPTEEHKAASKAGRKFFVDLNSETAEKQFNWSAKQIYIALGNLLLGSAALGINSTPIEGMSTAEMDKILDLPAKGMRCVVAASLGYAHKDDYNSILPKSRREQDSLFTFL